MQFRQITLVGVGLLGGSLGLAVKKRGLAGRVVGLVRRPESVAECVELGVVDNATLDAEEAVKDADLIVHCAPISQMRSLTEKFLPFMKPGTIVTDVGSVKESVVSELEPLINEAGGHFVGSHPMAGGEKTGVAHSRADLFEDATVVVTFPSGDPNQDAETKVIEFWEALQANLFRTYPNAHDKIVARTSHLPHVVASALVATVFFNPSQLHPYYQLCGPGFRDTTRIASGDPSMWRDILLENRTQVAESIGDLIEKLTVFKERLEMGEEQAEELRSALAWSKDSRDDWIRSLESAEDPKRD